MGDRETPEAASPHGPGPLRPRLAVVLACLTVTVAVFAVRIFQDTRSSQVDLLIRTGLRLYGSHGAERGTSVEPADVDRTVAEWTGARFSFPREDGRVTATSVRREKVGRRRAAAVRFVVSEDVYLLLVVRNRGGGAAAGGGGLFSGGGFLSGETEGKSFVYWEREGTAFFLVTSADLGNAIDLARRYLS